MKVHISRVAVVLEYIPVALCSCCSCLWTEELNARIITKTESQVTFPHKRYADIPPKIHTDTFINAPKIVCIKLFS